MVNMKVKFVSAQCSVSGELKGKLRNAAELIGSIAGRSAEAGVAALIIKEGGVMGIITVACLALAKWAFESDV